MIKNLHMPIVVILELSIVPMSIDEQRRREKELLALGGSLSIDRIAKDAEEKTTRRKLNSLQTPAIAGRLGVTYGG